MWSRCGSCLGSKVMTEAQSSRRNVVARARRRGGTVTAAAGLAAPASAEGTPYGHLAIEEVMHPFSQPHFSRRCLQRPTGQVRRRRQCNSTSCATESFAHSSPPGRCPKEVSPIRTLRYADMTGPPLSWLKLGERPGRELVLGQIARPWPARRGARLSGRRRGVSMVRSTRVRQDRAQRPR